MKQRIPSLDSFINEAMTNTYNIDDIIEFKDGEEWIVVKPGMRHPSERVKDNEITIKPYNKLAKDRNVSFPIDVTLDFIEKNKSK